MARKNQSPGGTAAVMPPDPSKPLDVKREKFLKRLMLGDSAAEAYRKVSPNVSDATCETNGPALKREAQVLLRFQWMQKQVEADTFLTVAEKRNFLALAVRTPIGEVDENHVLCQSLKRRRIVKPGAEIGGEEGIRNAPIEWEIEEIKSVDKLASLREDNVMAGHHKPQEVKLTGEVSFRERLDIIRSKRKA